ncbi:VanZ family protein [Leucobacter tenebrionis]|uniref:VanZ family protein n=1 Tax=Leucobacter tenebrionis TaxID=2873270 RepID=UPI001CA62F24|nr:VanZ family protein [Leucobacter tenebrionis]QZY51797.1 VanZ family protein [Leucobacter tenebrionis]
MSEITLPRTRTLPVPAAASAMPRRPRRAAVARPTPAQRALLGVLLAVYIMLLVWVVVWKLEAPYSEAAGTRLLKLVPFVSTAEYGSSAPREVLANLLLFTPLGVYLGLLTPRGAWSRVAVAGAATSTALEAAQYALAVGSADTTDVIVNTAGGLAGLALLALARRALGSRSSAVITRWALACTLVATVACAAFATSPLR